MLQLSSTQRAPEVPRGLAPPLEPTGGSSVSALPCWSKLFVRGSYQKGLHQTPVSRLRLELLHEWHDTRVAWVESTQLAWAGPVGSSSDALFCPSASSEDYIELFSAEGRQGYAEMQ